MILTVTANPAVDAAYFVDEFTMGEVHRPIRTVITAGGKGLNVSRVASILGESVTAMGFLGGSNGEFIKSEVSRLGIKGVFTEVSGETRRNIDIVDSCGRVGEILEAGPEISDEEKERFLVSFGEEVKKCDIVCISGSLPRGLDGSFYVELIRLAKGNGKKVILDTSGKALEDGMKAEPFMIKPNLDELKKLFENDFKTDSEIKDALKSMYDRGIELPFVTLGGDGAMLFDGDKFYKFTIPHVDIKNTVGSGDSTVGGIATGLDRGMSFVDAVKLGMACGIANTQFDQTGTVSRELVEKFYKEIKIREA
ncbi:MAG: 1-phosphofructokinase [Ruminococcaceae bacterium]|nr:1-phosphofructokinase [Oscillospiraceae bacterium]